MKRIALVTGAEGFIGSHLVKFLHDEGWRVIGTHLPGKQSANLTLRSLRYEPCDLRDAKRVGQLCDRYKPTHIFHLGAQSLPSLSWKDPVGTFEANIMGSLHLFEAARHMKRLPTVVSACSSAEYGNVPPAAIPVKEDQPLLPLHPYGISKVCLDLLARQYWLDYKIPAVNIRLFNTTGPGKTNDAPSDFVRQLVRIKKGLQPAVVEVGNLKPRRAFLDVNDTARGFYLAALKGKHGESYNLCATRAYRIQDMLRTVIRLSGVTVQVKPVARLMRPSDEKIIFGSTHKVRRDTGWQPRTSMEQTLRSMFEYWEKVI
jgi:GDP-4-dehydro-6-deoxy-D-mannose reductase